MWKLRIKLYKYIKIMDGNNKKYMKIPIKNVQKT